MSYQVRPGATTSTRSLRRRAPVAGVLLLLVAGALPASGQRAAGTSAASMAALARGEWPTYAGSYASAKYPSAPGAADVRGWHLDIPG